MRRSALVCFIISWHPSKHVTSCQRQNDVTLRYFVTSINVTQESTWNVTWTLLVTLPNNLHSTSLQRYMVTFFPQYIRSNWVCRTRELGFCNLFFNPEYKWINTGNLLWYFITNKKYMFSSFTRTRTPQTKAWHLWPKNKQQWDKGGEEVHSDLLTPGWAFLPFGPLAHRSEAFRTFPTTSSIFWIVSSLWMVW